MSKNNLNYIAGVEKAIAEKYGRTAAQDFRSGWDPDHEKEYLRQLKECNNKVSALASRKETQMVGDVKITKRPTTESDRTCPVCKTYSFSLKDDLYMNRFECCYPCYLDFVIAREDDWEAGIRPSEEQVSLSLKRRKDNG
jgi:hypothetical protein